METEGMKLLLTGDTDPLVAKRIMVWVAVRRPTTRHFTKVAKMKNCNDIRKWVERSMRKGSDKLAIIALDTTGTNTSC